MERKNIIIAIVVIILIAVGVYALVVNNNESDAPKGKLPGNICTMEYAPVCGVNGITYGNACMAGDMEIAYDGECTDSSAAGGTFPAGEVPENATDEELASS